MVGATVSKTDRQNGNLDHVAATWSLALTELTFLSVPVLALDNG